MKSSSNKICAFKKIPLWISDIEENDLTTIPAIATALSEVITEEKKQIKEYIKGHLSELQEEISKYFRSISTSGWEWFIAPDEEDVSKAELNCSEKANLSKYHRIQC